MDPSELECDICGKEGDARVGFHCATCARSAVYSLRIEHGATLLDKESLERRVEAVLHGASAGSTESITLGGMLVDTSDAAKAMNYERTRSTTDAVKERVQLISERASRLRQAMEAQKRSIAQKKARIAQRKSDAQSATHGLEERSARHLDDVRKGTKHVENKWQRTYAETVHAKVLLCREAANLAGLKLQRTKKGDTVRYFYSIAALEIFDLRNLNAAEPQQISACLTSVAHLLVRVSHYLAVRLPAEITLPHRDYPLPTIFAPTSSYQQREAPFPGSTFSHSGYNSPSASRHDSRPLPRPRALWLDRRLPQLSKEDPAAYSMFIEGISYLAWDVAWLCKTQSSHISFASWEDVCPLGKNLWQLLVADHRKRPPRRESSSKDTGAAGSSSNGVVMPTTTNLSLGQFSHASAYSFLGGGEMTQYMREWKLRSPAELTVKVRAHLISEMQGAEWDIIDEDGELSEEEPDVIGTKVMIARPSGSQKVPISKPGESGSVTPIKDESAGQSRPRGVNGWTKVKSRNSELAKR